MLRSVLVVLFFLLIPAACTGQSSAQTMEQVLRQKTARLKARDPAKEARSAANRGDFRLAGSNYIGFMPSGWSLPGVSCALWTRPAIGKWYVADDVISGKEEVTHGEAATRFVTRYNQALVDDPLFLYPELCAREGKRPKARYTGTVRTYAEAARSADPAMLAGVAAGADINARDLLGHTALHWALYRNDGEMARLLIERGADPAVRPPSSGGDFDGPAPLARALRMKNGALVAAMLDRGARFDGATGLCADRREPGQMFALECDWIGLVVSTGRADLIDRVVRDRKATTADDEQTVVQHEIASAFNRALDARQDDAVTRLLPLLEGGDPSFWVHRLTKAGRFDLARRYIALHEQELGRSKAESVLWATAASAEQENALIFLANYGGELNLLPASRLSACRTSASQGDIVALASCVREAADRRLRMEDTIKAGNTAGLLVLAREAADLHEYRRATIVDAVAQYGTADMMTALAPLVAPVRVDRFGEQRQASYPDGRFPQIASWDGLAALKQRLDTFTMIAHRAVERSDPALVASLATLRPVGVARALTGYMDLIEARIPMHPMEDPTTEALPSAPDAQKMAMIRSLVQLVTVSEGPQSMEEALGAAVRPGWNDVIRLMLAAGFRGDKAKRPDLLWQSWADLSRACKPSTGALLTGAGVRIDYPLDARLNGEPPLWIVAAACKNPASAAVLVQAGADPNTLAGLEGDGDTMVDVALQRQKPLMAEALRKLGGLTSAQLPPGKSRKRQEARGNVDWDLVPDEEVQ
ncbi:hypothetical protein GVO57_10540 [Sphingomonas changnyeongensis]|uniref:Ankyrin n=1 Tax=Sphingomonas changnyeongensis TaxID=2698679 RepID=A0A7Z2NXQ6_9SPHN|nr:ankyrin repeat domain-containing protein [Sphingomonas changnyeongensis]QHL91174.1 hypothetical protein GVO57_10540 [Sphingomonas changnyeongensis]